MNKNSLFAVLLRSPWWVSIAVAAAIFAAGRLALPDLLAPYAIFMALPFFGIGTWAGWQQLRAPSAARLESTLAALRAKPATEFAAVLQEAFRRDGHTVAPLDHPGADFELTKGARSSVVACKRWKAARTGIEPLKELHAAREAREAHEGIYIALGELSDPAKAFAAGNRIRVIAGPELARLVTGS